MNNNIPKVSVCVVTYNHEKYIKECLESIVTQKCDFDFEVIVGEDCSTDNTRAIVQEYANKYPNIVKPIFHEKNIGAMNNFLEVHKKAEGQLIASMDGDDFWYQGKLAYQVEIFDKNPDIVQIWHCADVIDHESSKIKLFPSKMARLFYPKYINTKDIALSYALVGQRSTQMFRAETYDINLLPTNALDYYGAFLISLNGKSFYSKKVFGAYRVVANNSLTTNTSNKRLTVDLLSEHLVEIAQKYPQFMKETKANIVMRRFIAKLKGFDLEEIDKNLEKMNNIKTNYFLVLKSLYYFMLQKI